MELARVTSVSTGWSNKTVNCNFFVTGVKITENYKTQPFLEMIHWEILIFWCLESTRRKQSLLSMLCQIGWFVSNQTGSHMEWALRQTPQHHWASKTHWNISLYPKIFPHIPNSFTKLYQAKIDTNRHWQTTGDSFLHVWLSQYGAKPPFWQNLERQKKFTWHFWDIKISKPPYVPFPKMVGFCHFLWIWHLSQRNYNWQSCWITL